MKRGGKSCEFVLHVDMTETEHACTTKWETALGPKFLQKSVQDALLAPLLDHIYKPKLNGPFNAHVNVTLEDDAPMDVMAPAQSYEREDGMPVDVFIVITPGAEQAAGARFSHALDGGGTFSSAGKAVGARFELTIEAVSGYTHKGLPSASVS